MGELEKRLKQLIDQKSGSVAAFARETGIPATTIYNALNRGIAGSTTDTVTRLYDALGVDWSSLSDFDSSRSDLRLKSDESGYEEIPLYGSIAAGVPMEMVKVCETFPIPRKMVSMYPGAFLLKVVGESMNRVLPNGCYALVDPYGGEPVDGRAYAVCVNGYDATVKRVHPLEHGIELDPDSTDPTFHPMVYDATAEDTETVTIIGEVVWYTVPFDFEI